MLLAAAVGCSVAATKRDEPTYTLNWKPVAGQEIDYGLSAQISSAGVTVEFLTDFHLKITKVEADGGYTTESKRGSTRMVTNGQEQTLPSTDDDEKVRIEKFDAKGKKISEEDNEDGEIDDMTAILKKTTDFDAPDKPVKKGDKWQKVVKADPAKNVKAATLDYEVLGESKIGTFDVVKVAVKYKQTEGDRPASFDGTLAFSTKDMSMVELTANVKDAPLDEENYGEVKVKLSRK